MIYGYARVSTDDQKTVAQIDALKAAGCDYIYDEAESGGRFNRPELQHMLRHLNKGDVVTVWKLDRLSRSLKDLLIIMEKLDKLGVGFRSLTEAIDTTTPAGRMIMHIVGAFAEFERAVISERTIEGIRIAKREGRGPGRKFALNPAQQRKAVEEVSSGRETPESCARIYGVHRVTIDRLLERWRRTVLEPQPEAELKINPRVVAVKEATSGVQGTPGESSSLSC
jgi:DNA invertase Pin-like site-specific DNA recombinase